MIYQYHTTAVVNGDELIWSSLTSTKDITVSTDKETFNMAKLMCLDAGGQLWWMDKEDENNRTASQYSSTVLALSNTTDDKSYWMDATWNNTETKNNLKAKPKLIWKSGKTVDYRRLGIDLFDPQHVKGVRHLVINTREFRHHFDLKMAGNLNHYVCQRPASGLTVIQIIFLALLILIVLAMVAVVVFFCVTCYKKGSKANATPPPGAEGHEMLEQKGVEVVVTSEKNEFAGNRDTVDMMVLKPPSEATFK